LEFNARLGDPEAQVVLPLLKTDFLEVVEAVAEHRLDQVSVEWHDGHAVCVVMTSAGYPGPYEVGEPISGLQGLDPESATVFHAGTGRKGADIVTAGGRVLGITGRGLSLAEAQTAAYRTAKQIAFKGCHYRQDIAYRALAAR
jgi:phosphoribosylamine---glycine ligase